MGASYVVYDILAELRQARATPRRGLTVYELMARTTCTEQAVRRNLRALERIGFVQRRTVRARVGHSYLFVLQP